MNELIKGVPIPTAGVALGLAALGNLLMPVIGAARPLCGALSALFALLLISKVVAYPEMIKEDFKNPIFASVSATLLMTAMQLAGYIAPVFPQGGLALWVGAVGAHLSLMVWFTRRFFRTFKLEQVFPTYFICYVGIIVAAVVSPNFGLEWLGGLLFWIGFACYPVLFALVTYRYAKHPVPDPARPLFCIYSAPASLSIVGYLAVTDAPDLGFVGAMLILGQMLFVIVLTKVPTFIRNGFFPSYAAMTFPFVITAMALSVSLDAFAEAGISLPPLLDVLCIVETVFAAAMVTFVVCKYVVFLAKPLIEARRARAAEGEVLSMAIEPE